MQIILLSMVKNNRNIKLVAFDLDGTLLNADKKISRHDFNTLTNLGAKGIIRVACTGRNLLSVNRVLCTGFPVDYTVFSTGAGIVDWHTGHVISALHLNKKQINHITDVLLNHKLSFTINQPIPNNHKMLLYNTHLYETDLHLYTNHYKKHVSNLDINNLPNQATQFIALLNNKNHFNELVCNFINVKTILTTSPVNQQCYWLEIFNPLVSKAFGIDFICKKHNILQKNTFSIGNDYNDIDMLKFTKYSYVVSNAPNDIKQLFNVTNTHNCSGFSAAINECI